MKKTLLVVVCAFFTVLADAKERFYTEANVGVAFLRGGSLTPFGFYPSAVHVETPYLGASFGWVLSPAFAIELGGIVTRTVTQNLEPFGPGVTGPAVVQFGEFGFQLRTGRLGARWSRPLTDRWLAHVSGGLSYNELKVRNEDFRVSGPIEPSATPTNLDLSTTRSFHNYSYHVEFGVTATLTKSLSARLAYSFSPDVTLGTPHSAETQQIRIHALSGGLHWSF